MASASAFGDTHEKCNGTKLARLLIDGGTETLKRTFDSIHPPANLQAVLHTNQPLLNKLRKKRVLNTSQWDKLYPPGGAAPDSKTFDITLLFVLLRDICGLTAPATGWNALPPAADVSREASLARIKYYRNQVYGHVTDTGVSETDFEQYWTDISGALIALGADQVGIDLLKSSAIGETEYLALLTKWKSEDDEVKEMFCELKEKLNEVDAKVNEALKQTPLLQHLSKCEFAQHIKSLVDEFQKGSRKWILDEVEEFSIIQQHRSRALVITALPGVGKSVLVAVACRNALEKGLLGACHFIQHNNSQRNNPRFIIESIARQLCDSVEGFKEKLHERLSSLQDVRKKLDEMNLETLTSFLLEEPLSAMPCFSCEQTFVIVIDALDEIEISAKEEFTSVLLRKLQAFPKWIRFVLTSRPTKQLLAEPPHVTVFNIETAGSNNTEDIRLYLSTEMQSLYYDEPIEELEAITVQLTERSRGIFLYAHFAIESAKKRNLSLSEISKLFPKGISSVYEEYLTRTQNELNLDEEKFVNFLEGIVAAGSPLPQSFALQILGINNESRQEKKVARKVLISLSLLFPEESKCISIFHKSLVDWLTIDDEDDSHDFCVKVADGHRVLAEQCLKVLRDAKKHKSFPPELNDSENYALTFGFHHMLEAGGYEEQLGECVQDLELLAAGWVARGKTTSNSSLHRQRELVEELERIVDLCSLPGEDLSYLCKTIKEFLEQMFRPYLPQIVLQYAACCPSSTGLSSKAIQLLSSSKYRYCPWVNKQKIYSFEESFHVNVEYGPLSSKHTVVCVGDSELMTLSIEGGQCLAKVGLDNPRRKAPLCVRLHKGVKRYRIALSDKYVAVYATHGRQLQLRDVRTLQIQRKFKLERFQLLSCCFVPGNKLAAGYEDGTVRVFDVASGEAETTLKCPVGKPVYCTASPSGLLLTVEEDSSGSHSAVLWRSLTPPEPMQLVSNVCFDFTFKTSCVSFSPNGMLAAFLCFSRLLSVVLFDVTTTHFLKSFPSPESLSCPRVLFIDDSHVLLADLFSQRVISIDEGSFQELVNEVLFLYQYYKGTRECFAIEKKDHHTLYKLTFHNLK